VTDALCAAAAGGDLEIIRLLVDGGADFTLAGSDGSTPLERATRKGHMPVVTYLKSSLRKS
jgi:ankyrin repeat protein